MMGVLKLASNRSFSVQDSMHRNGDAVRGVERALSQEAEDTGSSPDPGFFCHQELRLSFFTCNRKIYT